MDAALEFPSINPGDACHKHRTIFTSFGPHNKIFHSGLSSINAETGATETYDFGPQTWVGEPVFAPAPGNLGGARTVENGWLIAQGLDGKTGNSFFAILNADRIADGPVAIARLESHLPYSFHGHWAAT